MSRQKGLLALSVLLNAGLIVFLATPATSRRAPPQASVATVKLAESTVSTAPSDALREPTPASARAPQPMSSSGNWTRDVAELVAELRRRGVDEGTVRRLGVAQAERLYRLAARALLEPPEHDDYWRPPGEGFAFGRRGVDATKLREFQRLRRARIETLDELFGEVDAEATEFNTVNHFAWSRRDGEYLFAPPDKRVALTEYFERVAAGAGQTAVQRLIAQQMYMPAQEVAHDDEVRKILGAELFDDYVRQSSATASRLKYALAAFEPSRAEFDALLQIEREYLPQTGELVAGASTAFDMKQYGIAETARRDAVREALGDARYADYVRATDEAFRHLDALARELGLGPAAARAAFAHVERARKELAAVLGEGSNMGDPKARDAYATARRETQTRVAAELGLQSLSSQEQQMVLGQALSIHPREAAARMFRWN